MSLALFIAGRLHSAEGDPSTLPADDASHGKRRKGARPATVIATAGIAVGLAVMMISLAVIDGFKGELRAKVAGIGADMQMINREAARSYEMRPVVADDSLLAELTALPGIRHAQRFATKPGMVKTNDTFQGIVLKGFGPEYDLNFLSRHMVEGELPTFSDSTASNRVVISQTLASKLALEVGQRVDAYFIEDEIRVRRLTVVGVYQTNFAEFDNLFALTDLALLRRLSGWEADQVSGIELLADGSQDLTDLTYDVGDHMAGRTDAYGADYTVRNVRQLNPGLFAWLDLLDMNIWVILVLMTGVAGFTIISGLLIIIIERTSLIGILKSLGARNGLIRRLFLWLAMFMVARGMLVGDVVGLAFYFLQKYTGILKLDAADYYMDTVPVALDVWTFLALNVGTLLVSVLILIGPSALVARIRPSLIVSD